MEGVRPYNALIDTGASRTMISARVAMELELEPVGKMEVSGVSGRAWTTTYLFHVAFYDTTFRIGLHNDDGDQHSTEDMVADIKKTHVYAHPIIGGGLDGQHSFDVLLGMDVITTGCLIIEKNGRFSFNFE